MLLVRRRRASQGFGCGSRVGRVQEIILVVILGIDGYTVGVALNGIFERVQELVVGALREALVSSDPPRDPRQGTLWRLVRERPMALEGLTLVDHPVLGGDTTDHFEDLVIFSPTEFHVI